MTADTTAVLPAVRRRGPSWSAGRVRWPYGQRQCSNGCRGRLLHRGLVGQHGWDASLTVSNVPRTDIVAQHHEHQTLIAVQCKVTAGSQTFLLNTGPSRPGRNKWFILVALRGGVRADFFIMPRNVPPRTCSSATEPGWRCRARPASRISPTPCAKSNSPPPSTPGSAGTFWCTRPTRSRAGCPIGSSTGYAHRGARRPSRPHQADVRRDERRRRRVGDHLASTGHTGACTLTAAATRVRRESSTHTRRAPAADLRLVFVAGLQPVEEMGRTLLRRPDA